MSSALMVTEFLMLNRPVGSSRFLISSSTDGITSSGCRVLRSRVTSSMSGTNLTGSPFGSRLYTAYRMYQTILVPRPGTLVTMIRGSWNRKWRVQTSSLSLAASCGTISRSLNPAFWASRSDGDARAPTPEIRNVRRDNMTGSGRRRLAVRENDSFGPYPSAGGDSRDSTPVPGVRVCSPCSPIALAGRTVSVGSAGGGGWKKWPGRLHRVGPAGYDHFHAVRGASHVLLLPAARPEGPARPPR